MQDFSTARSRVRAPVGSSDNTTEHIHLDRDAFIFNG